jgi:hypothetical protein
MLQSGLLVTRAHLSDRRAPSRCSHMTKLAAHSGSLLVSGAAGQVASGAVRKHPESLAANSVSQRREGRLHACIDSPLTRAPSMLITSLFSVCAGGSLGQ